MGKRKTKNKAARGYTTTSTQSLTEKMGLVSAREQEEKAAKEAAARRAAAAEALAAAAAEAKENSEGTDMDGLDNLLDGDGIRSKGARKLLPWEANPIPREFEPVFAGRKRMAKLRGMPLKGDEAHLSMKLSTELEALQVLENVGMLDPNKTLWKGSLDEARVRSRMLANVLELEDLGFELEDITEALRRGGPDAEACLEWLSLHLDEEKLPPGWTQERVRKSVDRRELDVVVNQTEQPESRPKTSSDMAASKAEQQQQQQQQREAEEKDRKEQQRKVEEAAKAAKEKEDEKEKERQRIMLMYQQQQEEEEALEEEARASEQARAEELSLPPLERGRRLQARVNELRAEASAAMDISDQRRLGREIKHARSQLTDLLKRYPEIKSAISLAKDTKEKESTDTNPDTPNQNAQNAQTNDDKIATNGDDADEVDEGEVFADLFAEVEGADDGDAKKTSGEEAESEGPAYEKIDLGPMRGGLEPSKLLEQHVRRIYSKQTRVRFPAQTAPVPTMHACSAAFADITYAMPEGECCESKRMAQNYISLRALYDLASDMSYNLQMPIECQDLWNTWKTRDEHARLTAEHETKWSKIKVVDQVMEELASKLSTSQSKSTTGLEATISSSTVDDWSTGRSIGGALHEPYVDHTKESEALLDQFEARAQSEAYMSMAEERASLPVLSIEADLLRALDVSDVVIVSGQTGSGKTTQIPHLLMAHEMRSGRGALCNIACCEPRRISAVSVAERVSEEMADSKIGASDGYVGYQIRGERRAGSACRILYCTTGIILAQLRSDPLLLAYSHVVVDEVHERTVDSDFLLVVLRKIARERGEAQQRPLKVVLMSATIDLDKLANYFGGAPVLEAGGRTFPVTRFPLEDAVQLTGYACELESEYCRRDADQRATQSARMGQGTISWTESAKDVDYAGLTELDGSVYHENAMRTIFRLDESRVNFDLIESLLMLLTDRNWRPHADAPEHAPEARFQEALGALEAFKDARAGAILVFLPGMYQIQTLYNRLTHGRYFGDASRFLVLRLHSSLSSLKDEQRRVFEAPRAGVTKIVLSTNIAETGVTIPDVVYTIDSARVKQVGFNPARQMQSLEDTFVSRASLTQRAGRAGRVKPGIAFQLVSTQTQRDQLADFQQPEIRRVSLEGVCLQIMAMHAGGQEDDQLADPWRFLKNALDPPLPKAVNAAMLNLVEAGAVVMETPDTENPASTGSQGRATADRLHAGRGADLPDVLKGKAVLTPLGMHLSHFPLDMKIGRMVIYGALFGCLDPVMTVAASIGHEQKLFLSPAGRQAEAANAHRQFKHECSDLLTLHNVYRAWCLQAVRGGSKAENSFSRANFVSQRSLEEMRKTKHELLQLLQRMGFANSSDRVDPMDRERPQLGYKNAGGELNRHADNVALVCAVLCAGLFPNVAMVTRRANKRYRDIAYVCRNPRNNQDEAVGLVERSVNAGCLRPGKKVQDLRGPVRAGWLTFLTKFKTNARVLLFDSTFVPHAALPLFGGSVLVQYRDRALLVDRWCRLVVPPKTAVMIKSFRKALDDFLLRKFDAPDSARTDNDSRIVDMIVKFFVLEE
ncbi:ATP-dependent RNA helicase DHX29 [Hondaea fermentalgiana]|uniref:RNA helicase n=1 Tax=Hondaea fermentalgiana TaxID=2315210 RepID=A0A2R5GRZ2_9STRA|nr:ATP-dependent RNA helicase DHX29 [Hondaea fermentalgiana]|eukprot:GBG32528.1 ATP-dependent RNA helicase DHX29 [Hondaea fermentalgiana]